jgi:hypothetical protein
MLEEEEIKFYILRLIKDEFNEIRSRLILVEDDLKQVKKRFNYLEKDEQWISILY